MVKCDICTVEFEIKAKVRKHPNKVEEVYFICPNCKKKYTGYYTNEGIRIKQDKINKLWEKYRKDKSNNTLGTKIMELKKEINENMDRLRMKMIGTQ